MSDIDPVDHPAPGEFESGEIRLPGGIGDLPAYPRRPTSGPLVPPPPLPFPVAGSTVAPGSVPTIDLGQPPPAPRPIPPPPPPPAQPPPPPAAPGSSGSHPSPAPAIPDAATLPAAASSAPGPVVVEQSVAFVPLRSDPPPRLLATWWLRYLLLLTMFVAIAVVVMAEYSVGPGGVAEAPLVLGTHVLAALLLVAWTVCAMFDADRLVPATRYHRGSSCTLGAVLWLVAFAAPIGFTAVFSRARVRFDDPEGDLQAVAVAIAAGVVALILVWLPFGYLAGQAQRVGAPRRVVVLWFVGSMFAAIGSTAIVVIGLDDTLADGGMTPAERAARTAVVYGIPAFVFALSTWRATTVFDEVIDLRWRRWASEWEMTLLDLAAQPAPGPELATDD